MKVSDLMNEVARRADTADTKINVATTKRVISELFGVLAEMDAAEALDTMTKGVSAAAKKL
jgi:hypothetical protein